MGFEFSVYPNRVLTVTGILVAFTTVSVSFTILGISFNIPLPLPFPATFLTGHPQFMSMKSGFSLSAIFVASVKLSSLFPNICIPNGRSSSSKDIFTTLCSTSLSSASEDINSVIRMSAP